MLLLVLKQESYSHFKEVQLWKGMSVAKIGLELKVLCQISKCLLLLTAQ